jgi:hypothetical protein
MDFVRRVRVTAWSRQTNADTKVWAPTSSQRWQPRFTESRTPTGTEPSAHRKCGWKQGESAADSGKGAEYAKCGSAVVDDEEVWMSGNGPGIELSNPVQLGGGDGRRHRPPEACGRGAAPNPARGTSPLRPPAPFPCRLIVRNGPHRSRVRKPRRNRAPLTDAARSEDFPWIRERGPKKCASSGSGSPPVGRHR